MTFNSVFSLLGDEGIWEIWGIGGWGGFMDGWGNWGVVDGVMGVLGDEKWEGIGDMCAWVEKLREAGCISKIM